jgi:anti-sigma-K factor RskA
MKRDKYTKYVHGYVLSALSPAEKREFEDHLRSGCPDCAREVAEMMTVAAVFSTTVEQKPPRAEVRERILSAIDLDRGPKAARGIAPETLIDRLLWGIRRKGVGIAFGLTVVVLVMVIGFSLYVLSLLRTVDRQKVEITALKDDLQKKEELLNVLQARRVDMVIMNGLEPSPEGYGKIIWDPERKVAILQISNLPTVPKDKDYQLWVIKDKKPVSAGVFAITSEKEGFFKITPLIETDLKHINAFAVTLEPKGGVPQPTGKMYLLGTPGL